MILSKRKLHGGFVIGLIWALLIFSPGPVYSFHWPWDQGHDTCNPNLPPDERSHQPPCDCKNATGSPVVMASGRYFRTVVDLSVPTQGIPLEISRTYNANDRHNGLFGYGWIFNLGTRLIPVTDGTDRFAIVRVPDSRRFYYRQTGGTTFAPPAGAFNTLTRLADGTYALSEMDGSRRTFNADGNLTSVSDRYGSGLTLTYTADGFISSVSDNAGRIVRFTLNANGKIASVTDYSNRTVTYSYDAAGRLISVRDANGIVTGYEYDANQNLSRITVRVSDTRTDVVAQITYDGQRRATRVTDAEGDFSYSYGVGQTSKIDNARGGATWVYKYDSRGIITEVRDPAGNATRRDYDANGKLTRLADKRGVITRYEYDAQGNILRTTEAAGLPEQRVTSATYEPVFNRKTSETNARGVITRYEYDARGNRIRVTEAAGLPEQRVTNFEYDASGNLTRTIYPDGSTERFTYDSNGKMLTRADALNNVTQFAYDALGRLQTLTDANNHTLRYTYDAMDRVAAVIDHTNNRTDFTYDAAGNPLTVTNAVGEVTRYTYDAFGRRLTATDALGNTLTSAYDAHGKLASQLNASGKIVYYKYDAFDRLIQIIQKVGETLDRITANDAVTEYTYDLVGNRTSVKDPNGNLTRTEYDALNRPTREIRANGLTVTYTYDVMGNVTRVQRSDGTFTTLQYDNLNRVTQEADSLGATVTYAYDALGRRNRITDANGNVTRYGYDAAGRSISTTDPSGRVTTVEYDKVGNVQRQTDRAGRSRSYTYDALDRVTAITDAAGSTTTLTYDAIDRITALRDGNNQTTTYTYTSAGMRFVTRQTFPDGRSLQLEFDGVGNRVRRVDPGGAVTNYVYDDLNRLTRRSYPSGGDDSFTYDKAGQRLTATNANAAISFIYDAVGRVTQVTQNGAVLAYVYNAANTERTLTYPGGRRVKETYDDRHRLRRVDNLVPAMNTIAQFTYDAANRPMSRRWLNGIQTDFTYDANNNVTQLVANLGSSPRVGFEYRFDNEDNRLSLKRLHDLNRSERYVYDAVHRLSQFRRGVLDATGEIPSPTAQSVWTLDNVGNWSRLVQDSMTETRVHNNLNQTTSVDGRTLTYDPNGNLTDDGLNTYAYDFENRLTQVTRRADGQVLARFRYDALQRRVEKEVGGVITTYLYDDQRVIEERRAGAPVATYVHGQNVQDILAMERGGQSFYYHANSQGTIEALSDAAGAIVERYIYDPYGRVRFFDGTGAELAASAVGNPYLFTAQRWDAEVGLYDYRARHYHPALGRFLQRDPVGYLDSLNLYAYVSNNPIRWVDPSGTRQINFEMHAFIPGRLGEWLPEPFPLHQLFGWYFHTDNRDFGGRAAGTSRVFSLGGIASEQIGKITSAGVVSRADPSRRRRRLVYIPPGPTNPFPIELGPWIYEEKTASVTQNVSLQNDEKACVTSVKVSAEGSYPFVPGPPVYYEFTLTFSVVGKNSVRVDLTGRHKSFPNYEVLVDGAGMYQFSTSHDGPSPWLFFPPSGISPPPPKTLSAETPKCCDGNP